MGRVGISMKIYLHSLDIEDIIKIKTTIDEDEYVQFISIANTIDVRISGVDMVRTITNEEIRIIMKSGVYIDLKYPYDKGSMIY